MRIVGPPVEVVQAASVKVKMEMEGEGSVFSWVSRGTNGGKAEAVVRVVRVVRVVIRRGLGMCIFLGDGR